MTDKPEKDEDAMKLADLARGLPPTDVDPAAAERIAALARRDVGHGPPKRRWIEAGLVAVLVLATLAWVGMKIYEMLGR
ncbi:MAG TPA: hypothetical protein VFQ65_25470 [Kofleriaceae bacterium]|nr:hypothetical protein [Kofleriaceae bacterium]